MERHNKEIAELSLQELDLSNQLVRDLEMFLVLNKQLQKLGPEAKNEYLTNYADELREQTDKLKQELAQVRSKIKEIAKERDLLQQNMFTLVSMHNSNIYDRE